MCHWSDIQVVIVNLVNMMSVQDGTVYLGLVVALFDEGSEVAHWSGHCEFSDGSQFEFGPDFLDASEAVTWWRKRGVKNIYIRLDFEEYLWAGEGSPPDGSASLSVFDPTDPRGRPDGALNTTNAMRRALAKEEDAVRVAAALEEGRHLAQRRESIHLSLEQLADRVGLSAEWLLDVESGKSSDLVEFSQWVNLVWATRDGWPEEKRTCETTSLSWVGQRGHLLREAELFVNEMLGLYD